MPYFVFRIDPQKAPTLVDTFDKFNEAKERCRELRKSEAPDDPNRFRMSFAEDAVRAKRLLTDKRPPQQLEEWEA